MKPLLHGTQAKLGETAIAGISFFVSRPLMFDLTKTEEIFGGYRDRMLLLTEESGLPVQDPKIYLFKSQSTKDAHHFPP